MTSALLRKELRALRPWVVLSVLIGVVNIAEALFQQPDMRPLSELHTQLGGGFGIVMWIVAYAIGTGLVSREQDDGTLVFLDGLPVSRTHVFAVKCVLTCGLIAIAPGMTLLLVIVQHQLSHGSLDAPLRLDLVLGLFGLQLFAVCQGVFVGAAMGLLRSLTWLVTSAIAVSLRILIERVPRSGILNPLALLKVEVASSGLILDRETLWAQLSIAVLAALLAWRGFLRAGRASALSDLSKRPVLGATTTALTLAVLTVALVLMGRQQDPVQGDADDAQEPFAGKVQFKPSPLAQTATRHYHIAYSAAEAQQALALAAQADAIFERVHALLGAPLGDSIDVDTSGSSRNTEGTAYFGRVRMRLSEDAAVLLAHETSHVVAQRLAGAERDFLWRKARVLDEGLSTYVEQTLETDETRATLASDRLLLAALYVRHELIVQELYDPDLLATTRDEGLKYPMGAAVIRAMVKLYGPDSISRLVRAFANDKLPADLDGLALMEATFQSSGMDFAAVIAELFRQVSEDAELQAAKLAALPRLRVRLVRDAERTGVQTLCDAEAEPAPRRVHLRFKPHEASEVEHYDGARTFCDKVVWRAASEIQQGKICVQAGLRLPQGRVLYEPWTCLPTVDAALWQEPASETDPGE